MLSGTLVTVAGFIPIALAKSSTGEYAFAFFQINAVALLISWLAAVIAIPWLGYKLLPDPRHRTSRACLEQPPATRALASPDRQGSALNGPAHAEDHDVYGTAFYLRFRQLVAWCVQAALAGHRHHGDALRAVHRRHGQGTEAVLPEFDPP
jgi:multidrug efflux pump